MQGDAAQAAETLRKALALWRGTPLADVADADWAQAEIGRLDDLRLAAIEHRIDADLELGGHAAVVGELERLVARNPLREHLRAQLILALYRCGRHGEALQQYAEARRVFAEELGLEPSTSLRRLEQAILAQDPSLELPHSASPIDETSRGPADRRRQIGIAAALLAVSAAAAIALFLTIGRSSGGGIVVAPDSVAVIDSHTNRVVADVPLGGRPGGIAAGDGAVWVGDHDDGTVVRIDPGQPSRTRAIGVGMKPQAVAVGAGAVWAVGSEKVVRIDPHYQNVTATTNLHQSVLGAEGGRPARAVATGPAGVWIAYGISALSKVDPETGAVIRTIVLDDTPVSVAVDADTVWTLMGGASRLDSVDARTGSVSSSIDVPGAITASSWAPDDPAPPSGVALAAGSVWVPTAHALWRVDPITGGTTEIRTGNGSVGIAVGAGAVWIADYLQGTVSKIDPKTNRVVSTIKIGNNPGGIAVTRDRVWVTVY